MTPAMASNARTGTLTGLNDKHVAGVVKVAGGQASLSDFSSDPGPDLHIYLTNGTDENAVTAGKALGKISLDMPTQSFSTAGLDASQYNTVVIHCDKAKAVFGAATLT
ncbi:MAG: DM13 domain-containing protein [Mycobacterium sp.]